MTGCYSALSSPLLKRFATNLTNPSSPYSRTVKRLGSSDFPMASAVLQHVTTKKLAKLAEQQDRYEKQRKELLDQKDKAGSSLEYSRQLLEGIKKMKASQSSDELANIKLFLKQAEHDASVPSTTLLNIQTELEKQLDIRSSRFLYASLFGRLVTEWLENPNTDQKPRVSRGAAVAEDPDADFETVGRAEMHEQRKTWEGFVFDTTDNVDDKALKAYLTNLFGDEQPKIGSSDVTPFDSLRKRLGSYRVKPLKVDGLKSVIQGLIRNNLFVGAKRDALLDLKERPAVLAEMVDVLNMDLRNLQHWSWDSTVRIEQRRQVNGKYRFFMDEEIHQAVLLEYIGTDLAAKLKSVFASFYHTAWHKQTSSKIPQEDAYTRAYYLQELDDKGVPNLDRLPTTVSQLRQNRHYQDYFLVQMPDAPEEGARNYEADESDNEDDDRKSPVQLKQELLEYLTTEMLHGIHDRGEFSVLVSDFKWFGPSLPHKTILAVLKFFGVRENLLTFYKTFLTPSLAFVQDGPDASGKQRTAGVPMSHALSDAMGEAILFCLDFAVNKATAGSNLMRLHDDLWFWGGAGECETAWTVIQEFSKVTGLQLNEDKTGSVSLGNAKSNLLPAGSVQWGFLKLDAASNRWVIDKAQVDDHIKELKLQLDACRSIFAFIQAWNSYIGRFFTVNFGRSCNCLGPDHLDAVIKTFEHIQRELFPSGSVTTHIKDIISERFGVKDLPAGFLYFPIELGGLDLRNPFIPLLSRLAYEPDDPDLTKEERLQQSNNLKPEERLELAVLQEKVAYERHKAAFEQRSKFFTAVNARWEPKDPATFISFEEYSRFREETSQPLYQAITDLQQPPPEVDVNLTSQLKDFVLQANQQLLQGWTTKAQSRWIMALYGPEIVEKFGRLCIGDRELLPVGLVNVMRAEKVSWLG